jgi:hypothetical protein
VPSAAGINSAAGGLWTLREAQRLKQAGTWPIQFADPATITGLQLWLDAAAQETLFDATSGGSLVAADGAVARWEDKSGNARHATQGTSGSRPLRKTGIKNGLAVLRFDGSNDSMSIPSSAATFKFLHGGSTGYSTFAVVGVRALNTRERILETGRWGSPDGDGGGLGCTWGIEASGGFRYDAAAGGTTAIANSSASGLLSTPNFYALSNVGNVSSGTASVRSSMRVNGGAAITNNSQTGTPSTANSRLNLTFGFGVGHNGDGTIEYEQYADLDFCEIIIYNAALSDTDRSAVESYLMQKWAITPAPVPQTIAGLQAWYDASDASTLFDATTSGSLVAADGAVARWEDKSGNNRHATQATSGSRPLRRASGVNGLGALDFDGTNDWLSTSVSSFSGLTSLSWFAVVKNDDSGANNRAVFGERVNGDDGGLFFTKIGTSSILYSRGSANASTRVDVSEAVSFPTTPMMASMVTTSSTGTARRNGVSAGTNTTTTASVAYLNAMAIGNSLSESGQTSILWWDGLICELIFYNSALSNTDRAAVEQYLISKWSIT